jgi:hypothetical protein
VRHAHSRLRDPDESGKGKWPKGTAGPPAPVPFQVQIEYTNMAGARCLRVITDTRKITRTRQLAEKAADFDTVRLK